MIRAAVIAVLMLTAAVTGAVAFDHYRLAKVVSVASEPVAAPPIPETVPNQVASPHRRTDAKSKPRKPRKIQQHKPLLGKRYPGDDSANELNLRELR